MSFPRSFVQIHYHNRPGGVTAVMGCYAQAFSRLSGGSGGRPVVVCNVCSDRLSADATLYSIATCEYRRFRTRKSFLAVRDSLIRKLERVVLDQSLPRPVCVVGHNLTLGKNLALSSAFAALASSHGRPGSPIRFFSVVHDFAEEGRRREMEHIRRIAGLPWPVWQELYRADGSIRYAAVNERNCRLLGRAGLPVGLLLNSVAVSSGEPQILPADDRARVERALASLARTDGTLFDPSRPAFFYPVRAIGRKNLVEAIILCCILGKSNLIVGGPGSSEGDRALFSVLKEVARRHRLSIVFDFERICRFVPRALRRYGAVPLLYACCDRAVTTSVAEGFGYCLFESWVRNKAVAGRLPVGPRLVTGMQCGHLYERLDVPAGLIDVAALAEKYRASLTSAFGRGCPSLTARGFESRFRRAHVREGGIDFGVLDQWTQLGILDSVLESPGKHVHWLARWEKVLEEQEAFLEGTGAPVAVNRNAVIRHLGSKAFDRRFADFFSRSNIRPKINSALPQAVADHFCSPLRWRLLLSPQEGASKKTRLFA